MSLWDLINTYYISPVLTNQGYNPVNTLTYALLVVLATYLSYRLLEKMKIKIDRNFLIGFAPLVLLGTSIRLFEEAGISGSPLLVTPMIWIEMFALVLGLFFVAKFIEKERKIPYYKTLFFTGVFASILPWIIVLSKITNITGMLIALGILLPVAVIFWLIKWNGANKLVTLVHAFDAVATFTAVQFFGFTELHVIPRLLIDTLSPLSFIIVKLAVIVGILILIDKYSDDKNFNNYLKFIIGIIGFAPGLRDFYLLGLVS